MKSLTSLITVSLMLAAGNVLAQEPEKGTAPPAATPQAMDHSKMDMSGMKPADHQKMAADEFVKLDKNKDRKLGKAEIPAKHPLAAHFSMLDTNKDGSLSKAEFTRHHAMMGQHGSMDHSKMDHGKMDHGKMDHSKMDHSKMDHGKMDMSGKKPADHQKMAADEFATLDKNKDGTLSKVEVPAKHPLAAHFSMLDTNKDGSLGKAEFTRHHAMMGMQHGPMDHSKMDHGKMDHGKMDMSGKKPADHQKMAADEFATLDKNKDGTLSKVEVPAKHPLAAHFSMLDTNKDGSLSKAEFTRHHGM